MPDDERQDASDGSYHGDDELRVKPDRRQRHELRFQGQDGRRAEDPMPERGLEDDPDPTSRG
jgi:hypothetical protein